MQERSRVAITVFGTMIDRHAGGINPSNGGGQLIGANEMLAQSLFDGFVRGRGRRRTGTATESRQQVCQTIIGELFIIEMPSRRVLQCALAFSGPAFHRIHAMVVLRQHVGQPDDRQLTITQSLAITMRR